MDLDNNVRTAKRDTRSASELGRYTVLFLSYASKVYQTERACAEEIAVCSAVFSFHDILFRFGISEMFATKLRSCSKLGPNFDVLGLQFFEERSSKFLTQFYKTGPPSKFCQNLVAIDHDGPTDLGD